MLRRFRVHECVRIRLCERRRPVGMTICIWSVSRHTSDYLKTIVDERVLIPQQEGTFDEFHTEFLRDPAVRDAEEQ